MQAPSVFSVPNFSEMSKEAAKAASDAFSSAPFSSAQEEEFGEELPFDQEYFGAGDLTEIFSTALATTAVTRVTIACLANLTPAAQQFNLVKEIMVKLLSSMSDGKVVFDNTSAMVKLGPVLVKLAKAANTMVVSDFVDLSANSLEDLLSNLGSVTLRRKPRTDPFKILAYAASSNAIEDVDLQAKTLSASVTGVKYWFKFATRMCIEMHRDSVKPNFSMKNSEISKFRVLMGAIRRDVFPGSKTARTWHATFKFARPNKDSMKTDFLEGMVKYTPEFIAWCSRNVVAINGEDMWFAVSDASRSPEEVPTPYVVSLNGKPFLSDYYSLASTWVSLFEKGEIASPSAVLDSLRSLRAGTLLDHRVAKSTGDPVLGRLESRPIFYETVIAKLGDLYPVLEEHKGHIHYIGVTKAANLMVKAVIACAKRSKVHLYDVESRPSVVTSEGVFPVAQIDVVPPKANPQAYQLPANLEGSWLIMDTTPGSSHKDMNNYNMRYAEKALEGGALAVVVKLFKHDVPVKTHYYGKFLNRGRCHNGEFFAVFFNHKIAEYGADTLYPMPVWLACWKHNNVNRGCDDIIFGDLHPRNYPLIVRDVQSFSVKDHEKYATLVATCVSTPMEADGNIPEQIGALADKFNFERSWKPTDSGNTIQTTPASEAPSNSGTTQIETLALENNNKVLAPAGGRKFVVFPAKGQDAPPVHNFRLSQAPSKKLRHRAVGTIECQGVTFVGFEQNGMPAYEIRKDGATSLLCTSSGWDTIDGRLSMLLGQPESNSGLTYFTHDHLDKVKLVTGGSALLSVADKRSFNARFCEFLRYNFDHNGMLLVHYHLSASVLSATIVPVLTNKNGPKLSAPTLTEVLNGLSQE